MTWIKATEAFSSHIYMGRIAMAYSLQVDYLQGYYIAKPKLEPPIIDEDVRLELKIMKKRTMYN